MKKILEFLKTHKKAILITLFILVFIGFTILEVTNFINSKNEKKIEAEKEESKSKIEMNDETFESQKITGDEILDPNKLPQNGSRDVTLEEGRRVMHLKLIMPKAIKEKIEAYDSYENFENEVTKYLVENDFWSACHEAKSEEYITEDYGSGLLMTSFKLDDPLKLTLEVTYNVKAKEWSFNYH